MIIISRFPRFLSQSSRSFSSTFKFTYSSTHFAIYPSVISFHINQSTPFLSPSITMRWAIAYIVSYPQHQAAIQKEIDEVIGRDRLPNLSDRTRLPLLQATIMETLRLANVLQAALPHYTVKDTTLCGYRVPKGECAAYPPLPPNLPFVTPCLLTTTWSWCLYIHFRHRSTSSFGVCPPGPKVLEESWRVQPSSPYWRRWKLDH